MGLINVKPIHINNFLMSVCLSHTTSQFMRSMNANLIAQNSSTQKPQLNVMYMIIVKMTHHKVLVITWFSMCTQVAVLAILLTTVNLACAQALSMMPTIKNTYMIRMYSR